MNKDIDTYISTPSLHGLLSDDYLYFEGLHRPQAFFTIRDNNHFQSVEVLEKYFNDIYNLFLRKLSLFSLGETLQDHESVKLQALLQEMIKVKKLIESAADGYKERGAD